ncbi:NTP transferase domain-containing protein [Natrarchaeobius chitinivorans]|uniref:Cobalamin biosynthesis protein CobY n=1 Tax=Natrarchaeobius chitinivorans TaxID=1679083 RepID=A0A3N6M402_NATCH|nr:NTP transferase domain-containing protein [Natrarchaeobius chitinivorans]RQG96697.1 cobalamin biosynthesis protein CobY [Natrarchaeobius chitinivorans]
MCGGEGTRLKSAREKPLYPICDIPMVDRVTAALEAAERVGTIFAAVSPNAPETRTHLEESDVRSLEAIETPGDGYVTDLQAVLDRPELETPVLTVAADLPLLEGDVVDRILERHGEEDASRTVCVPRALKRRLGASVDSSEHRDENLVPAGVNIVGSDSTSMTHVSYDVRLAVNVNRIEDARLAAELLPRQEVE